MTLLSDQAVAERILGHIDAGTTDRGNVVWREPVTNYRSAERLERELATLFRPLAIPFCPSAALLEAGSFVVRDTAQSPVLVVRGADKKVRAFKNACRHRGAQVAEGSGRTPSFICRYHGWTYGLDGALINVPHEDGFPGLDRCDHGLVELPAKEHGGVVFMAQAPEASEPFAPLESVPELLPPELTLLSATVTENKANWKIAAEGFLEGYHIHATHRETFYPRQFDNLNVIECFGLNSRIAFPYRNIQKLRAVAPEAREVDGMLTFVYHLFPNAIVATFPQRIAMVVLEPIDVARTNFVTYTLARTDTVRSDSGAIKRDADFVEQGAREDRAVIESIQKGIRSAANNHFTFGHFESAIVHFHRNIHALLDT